MLQSLHTGFNKMKKIYLFLTAIIVINCFLPVAVLKAQDAAIYRDPSYPLNARVNDLISRMSLPEKVGQLVYNSPAIPRLRIPAYNWWNEGLHGVARSGVATIFPQAIGMAATFDDSLLRREAGAISDEARAMYNAATAKGYRRQYEGLTFWTPNINIFRDPRWGRGQETYGEDPYLTSRMGVAYVKGLQGDNPRYLKAAACAKHYAVHSGPEKLRHEFDAEVSAQDLFATYLPAFKALVDAGVAGVMCAYNSTNGEPCCANTFLLQDILRDKWGFKGYVTSDCGALADIYEGHHFVKTKVQAAAIALKHGVNLNCGSVYPVLDEAVKEGLVTEQLIDSSLATLLRIRFRLGLLDPPGSGPYDKIPVSVINSAAHRALARKAAEESIVLLKNDGALPLKNNLPAYYVTGPNASNTDVLMGNYYGVNDNMVTILEGLASGIAPGSQMQYKQGILLNRPNANPADWTTGDAKGADVCFVVLGISGLLEGEEGESIASPDFGDRPDYNIPQNQIDFLRKIRQGNKKPVITIVTGGSPMNLTTVDSLSDAVLLVWYPGEEGGHAVSDIVFGKTSPSGKLPITFPRSLDQLPPFRDYSMKGRTYRYMNAEPLYPFGYGLSYGHFTYSAMKVSRESIKKDQPVTATATIRNEGKYAGEDVVELYITAPSADYMTPLFSLKGFKRIKLKPGESTQVSFTITPAMMAVINEKGEPVINPGTYRFYIAGAAPVPRSETLGIAKPASAVCRVK